MTDDPAPLPPDPADETDDNDEADESPSVRPVDLRDYVDFRLESAHRVRVHRTANLAIDLWCIEPQQSTDVLQYPDRDVSYTVIGGRSWFVTDQGEIGLDPMGSMMVPAGVAHGIDNRGADPLIVLAAVSPPGEQAEGAPLSDAAEAIRDDSARSGLGRALRGLLGDR